MPHVNVEIKACCDRPDEVRAVLREAGADFRGSDRQVDTYFNVPHGRLKLREGNIENALIHYHRPDQAGPKRADVTLYHPADGAKLKAALAAALGVLVVVVKKREIYFLGNVKCHVDAVDGLGGFVEIEAIDEAGSIGEAKLLRQCRRTMELLGVRPDELVQCSYSDMLLEAGEEARRSEVTTCECGPE